MVKPRKSIIAVIGGSRCSRKDAVNAELIGRELAKNGVVVVCGGMGGVMEAVCRGASAENGITIGILPSDERSTANKYVQIPIATGTGEARNIAIVKSSQVVIAVGGEYGTLSEIAFALKSRIPVIGLNTWSLRQNKLDDTSIIIAGDAADAVSKALECIENSKRKKR